jgi:phosphatidylethanolamine/phosphatidyl-N-methylethanolamine N-methyltransferase
MGRTLNRGGTLSVAKVDARLIERVYARFASVYDWICGPLLQRGRREALRALDLRPGAAVLDVGIGTGLTASLYPPDCTVTGIDVSEAMLREALKRLQSRGRRNIQLSKMDAMEIACPDESFDVVYAAYVISVVPDPVAALREMHRVCRVGGEIVLLNHFRSRTPLLATLERLLSPLTARAGFRADLDLGLLLARAGLRPFSVRMVGTPRIWSLVRCRRDPDDRGATSGRPDPEHAGPVRLVESRLRSRARDGLRRPVSGESRGNRVRTFESTPQSPGAV